MDLKGKVAIVTGAGSGIGRGIAAAFTREGAAVAVVDLHRDRAEETVRVLNGGPGRPVAVAGDVRTAEGVDRIVEEATRHLGHVDVLVNDAAVYPNCPVVEMSIEEWDRVMAVNVKGIWNCVKAVAPAMKAQGGGRIVNIASAIAPKGSPYLLHYVVSKGAVITMTRALARELGEFGIAVNALAPGLTLSDTVLKNPEITAFQAAPVMQSRAFNREETPADLEGALIFLASSESAFMTGQTVVVDGGSIFV